MLGNIAEYVCMGSCWVRRQTVGPRPSGWWCLDVKQVSSALLLAAGVLPCLSAGSECMAEPLDPVRAFPTSGNGGHVDLCLLVINIDAQRASWRERRFIGVSLTVDW